MVTNPPPAVPLSCCRESSPPRPYKKFASNPNTVFVYECNSHTVCIMKACYSKVAINPATLLMFAFGCRESSPPRPYRECESNSHTVFVLTAHGGHCAHLPLGSWVTGKAWMDTVAIQFCSAVAAQMPSPDADAADVPVSTLQSGSDQDHLDSQSLLGKT